MKQLVLFAVVVAALVGPAVARADVATDWNHTMIAGLDAATVAPQPSSRIGAIVQASVFDAVNGIERRYTPYHVDANAPRGASQRAAAASAAYTALVALIPSQKALFDQQLQATLAQISDDPTDPGQSVDRGLAWGQSVANAILAWRATDGATAVLPPYVFGSGAGVYQPTPPGFGQPIGRQYANMPPFALASPSQFLPAGPPALTSDRYAQAFTEVLEYGGATSAFRTAEETQTAVVWQTATPTAIWNRVADDLAASHETTLSENARLLALMNIAVADATIATFNAKNTYNFWRPVTAIRATVDPAWTPAAPTPAHQEYPSAHSSLSSAAATVLASFYGDGASFAVTSPAVPGVERDFTSFTAAVQQVSDARVWIGFHFRFSVEDGATLGSEVGQYMVEHVASPVHGNEVGQLHG